MATTEENTILKITLDYEDAVYGILRYKEKIQELKDMQKVRRKKPKLRLNRTLQRVKIKQP